MFKKTIVHGIFVSSLFSTIFGRTFTGSIYVGQELSFKRPVFVDADIKAVVKVIEVDRKSKGDFVKCSTIV